MHQVCALCRTTATAITLATFSTRVVCLDSGQPGGKMDVLIDGTPGAKTTEVNFITGAAERRLKNPQVLTVDGLLDKDKTFWLPHNEEVVYFPFKPTLLCTPSRTPVPYGLITATQSAMVRLPLPEPRFSQPLLHRAKTSLCATSVSVAAPSWIRSWRG